MRRCFSLGLVPGLPSHEIPVAAEAACGHVL